METGRMARFCFFSPQEVRMCINTCIINKYTTYNKCITRKLYILCVFLKMILLL